MQFIRMKELPKEQSAQRWTRGWLVSWWGNGLPRRWSVAELRGSTATLGLRHGPDSYGRQQSGILHHGGNSDAVTPRIGRRSLDCKLLSTGKKRMTVPVEEAPANYVPAAAVIRRGRALSGFIGCKGCVDGYASWLWNPEAQLRNCNQNCVTRVRERKAEFLV